MSKQLRFAALTRVSGERQEKEGESLRVQAAQIEQAVSQLGGTITRRYAGQEHATAGYDREKLQSLLADAARPRRPFDAVMVADPSRWSRDNAVSKTGLRTLRDNGVRFFTLTTEHDLFDPTASLFLGMAAEINEYQAALAKKKSLLTQVTRAKQGRHAAGRKPWGRTFDSKTGQWGVDPEIQRIALDIANRYVAGEGMNALAAEYGLSHPRLHVNLTQRSGPLHTVTFDVPELGIKETAEIPVPPLLPPDLIRKIRETVEANKTYKHGPLQRPYLLSRLVFCGYCGGALSGCTEVARATRPRPRRIYKHFHSGCGSDCLHAGVRAEDLEDAVMRQLHDLLGNPAALERAIAEATPNREALAEAGERLNRITSELETLDAGRERLLAMVVRGTVTEQQAEKQLSDLTQKESHLRDEQERLHDQLHSAPSPDLIKRVSTAARRARLRDYDRMTWEEKRKLLELVFGGKLPDGRRMGVYLERIDGQKRNRTKQFRYTLRGRLLYEETGITGSADGATDLRSPSPAENTRGDNSASNSRLPMRAESTCALLFAATGETKAA